nr:MAG TPA: hypothetical protein [Caudoviricetes sp.]
MHRIIYFHNNCFHRRSPPYFIFEIFFVVLSHL